MILQCPIETNIRIYQSLRIHFQVHYQILLSPFSVFRNEYGLPVLPLSIAMILHHCHSFISIRYK